MRVKINGVLQEINKVPTPEIADEMGFIEYMATPLSESCSYAEPSQSDVLGKLKYYLYDCALDTGDQLSYYLMKNTEATEFLYKLTQYPAALLYN